MSAMPCWPPTAVPHSGRLAAPDLSGCERAAGHYLARPGGKRFSVEKGWAESHVVTVDGLRTPSALEGRTPVVRASRNCGVTARS